MTSTLRTVLTAFALSTAIASYPVKAAEISGAGATFPYPIYAKWADAYKKATGNGLNYQSIGSGGGIKQITARTVTFGASDAPLTPKELVAGGDLMQWPMVMGGIVPVANLDGIKANEITLDGPTLAKIFLGEITSWDDAAIKKLNPNVKLPSTAIAVVHRSDGSGTTFNFTNYLSKISPEWKSQVGFCNLCRVASRHRRQRQRRRRQQRPANKKFDWLRRNRLCQAEQAHDHQDDQ